MTKWWRLFAFEECSNTLPWESDRQFAPSLDFSSTTYGPAHLAFSLLVLSVRGLRRRTGSPTSSSHILTFGSLHAFLSSWYFCKLATTLSLTGTSKSFSSTSLGHAGTSVVVHKVRCFTSSGSTASAPYINWNGVKFVSLQTIVLWLHTILGMIFTHLLFFSSSSIFLIASNIKALALSTALLDWGWYTDVNATFIPTYWQKSLAIALSKYFVLSTVMCRGAS
jgi:hypothetical protein